MCGVLHYFAAGSHISSSLCVRYIICIVSERARAHACVCAERISTIHVVVDKGEEEKRIGVVHGQSEKGRDTVRARTHENKNKRHIGVGEC